MRHVAFGLAVAALALGVGAKPSAAASPSKPLGKMTCEDFLALDETIQPKAVIYAVAYAKGGKPEAAMVDIEATDTVTPIVIEECKAKPKESFWAKVKAEVAKLKAKM